MRGGCCPDVVVIVELVMMIVKYQKVRSWV
jgi:hypothetical protein